MRNSNISIGLPCYNTEKYVADKIIIALKELKITGESAWGFMGLIPEKWKINYPEAEPSRY